MIPPPIAITEAGTPGRIRGEDATAERGGDIARDHDIRQSHEPTRLGTWPAPRRFVRYCFSARRR